LLIIYQTELFILIYRNYTKPNRTSLS
jgi:hypothetical protein